MKNQTSKWTTDQIDIFRLDYKNPTSLGGLPCIPTMHSIADVMDHNEISSIYIYCNTKERQAEIFKLFPAFLKARQIATCSKTLPAFAVYMKFNTFWLNGTTGDKNETAIKRRNRAIEIIKKFEGI